MDIAIHNSKKKVSVSDDAFAASFNEALVHQLVVSHTWHPRAPAARRKNPLSSQWRWGEALAPEGYRAGTCRYHSQPDLALRRGHFRGHSA